MGAYSLITFVSGIMIGGVAVLAISSSQAPSSVKEVSSPRSPAGPKHKRSTEPEVDWLARAQQITMPDRREYALPLNNPDVVSASSATHMEANDLVVGITYHGHTRAYPWWILSNFHVVNDTIITNTAGKVPVYIGLCEQCSGAAAFVPLIEELPGPFEENVTQTYLIRLDADPFESPAVRRLEPQYRKGDIVSKFLENDEDDSGDLSGDEIPAALRGADGNKDGRVDATEMQGVEVQLLRQQDYQW